jgi:AAA domain, putative AbiEii toxin, Type IV TA system
MLKSLEIENFRGFESFELKQLGRINLLVGENNSGKTSVLEAIRLLHSTADLTPLREQLLYRGETLPQNKADTEDDLDICHLFRGHSLGSDSYCIILGHKLDGITNRLNIRIDSRAESSMNVGGRVVYAPSGSLGKNDNAYHQVQVHGDEQIRISGRGLLNFLWLPTIDAESALKSIDDIVSEVESISIGLLPKQGVPSNFFRAYRQFDDKCDVNVQWIPSNALSAKEMIDVFNQIVLTPEEELATEALQIIDPTIRRLAPSGTHNHESGHSHGGFLVLKNGMSQRVPIGSMGDGIWRCLGLALKIANAKDGILLVDEIDTGLHFSTMLGMWKMIWKTAERLNVQVFATTHSRDCWESLAEVAESEGIQGDEVMIHRIERGRKSSVTFNSPQMTIAAERGIEVR